MSTLKGFLLYSEKNEGKKIRTSMIFGPSMYVKLCGFLTQNDISLQSTQLSQHTDKSNAILLTSPEVAGY